jgi:hypothetical protein
MRWLNSAADNAFSRTRLLQQGPHHIRTEFVSDVRIRQQPGGEQGFLLLHLVDALLDGVL